MTECLVVDTAVNSKVDRTNAMCANLLHFGQ